MLELPSWLHLGVKRVSQYLDTYIIILSMYAPSSILTRTFILGRGGFVTDFVRIHVSPVIDT